MLTKMYSIFLVTDSGSEITYKMHNFIPLINNRLLSRYQVSEKGLDGIIHQKNRGQTAKKVIILETIHALNVANYNLGKVRIKPMQSSVSPITICDLRGGPLETCCIEHAVLQADHCRSFAVYFCKSLQILAPSPPSLLVAGL